jgi:hypothetical protein
MNVQMPITDKYYYFTAFLIVKERLEISLQK